MVFTFHALSLTITFTALSNCLQARVYRHTKIKFSVKVSCTLIADIGCTVHAVFGTTVALIFTNQTLEGAVGT